LAVPFREQRYSHTPSESIANNYTPSANELKVKSLPSQNVFKKKSSGKHPHYKIKKKHLIPHLYFFANEKQRFYNKIR